MSAILLIALAAGSPQVSHQFSRDWQSCLIETSKLWAAKPGTPEVIVDAATIYCRDKLDLYMISEIKEVKELGLNEAQAAEYTAFLAGNLLRMNRGFALEVVQRARSK
jgi:hypothetical protein